MIHVITAVHNRYKITQGFVELLNKQTYKEGIHLLLVDDGSTDGTADMVQSQMNNVTILRGDGDLWWGGALHMAYQWIVKNCSGQGGDYLWIVNDDTAFDENYIDTAVDILNDKHHTLLSGEGYSTMTHQVVDQVVYHDYTDPNGDVLKCSQNHIGDTCSTRSLFMRVADFIDIGDFHPVLLPHYGSDYEWTYRASKKGYVIMSDSRLQYEFDENTTGDNFYETLNAKKVFSKRSVANPIYKFSALFLMTPPRYMLREIKNQCRRYWKKRSEIVRIMKR